MKAYKFTNLNRQSIYGVSDYPPIGEWSEPRTPVLCQSGWHIPDPESLSSWLAAELWEVEVDGKSVADGDKSSHERIKFVSQVIGWDIAAIKEFAQFCAEQAQSSDAAYAAAYAAAGAAYAAAAAAAAADARAAAAAAARAAAADARAAAARAAYAAARAAAADARAAAARAAQSTWIRQRCNLT